uniref:FAD-binding domain-containing protein n=1 Tax=Cyclophora tenuis TaxID=216820 RepID=A0A7S1D4E7_CYCTE
MKLEGAFVVGSDGVHSATRDWLSLPAAVKTGSNVFRGNLLVDSEENVLYPLLSQGIVPLHGMFKGVYFMCFNFNSKVPGKLAWVISTTQARHDGMSAISAIEGKIDDEDKRNTVMELLSQSDPSHLAPYPETSVLQTEVVESCGWGGKGRVTLIGDAAHAMRPTDGQGGNMALEDAVVLCRALREKTTIEEALRWFETTRLPRIVKIHADQADRYARRMRREQVGPWSDEFKKWVHDGI